jgi:tetratricopeptide (TPR) repeat protein
MSALRFDSVEAVYRLIAQGRAADALRFIEPLGAAPGATQAELTAYAEALRALGRAAEALEVCKRAVTAAPLNEIAEHNLAAQEQRMGHHAQAEASARRSIAKGSNAPETWVLLAAALQCLQRDAEAEIAYREALRRRPLMAQAQRDLAQLIWMRTGDADAATETLRHSIKAFPGRPELIVQLADALRFAGKADAAYDVLIAEIERAQQISPALEVAASIAAAERHRWKSARRHAERALAGAPGSPAAIVALCDAQVAIGDLVSAAKNLNSLHKQRPNSQHVLARLATVWRLLGDPRYPELYDYRTLVRCQTIDTPEGWPNLPAFLAELANALRVIHTMRTHPYDQSIRHGTQTCADLTHSEVAAIRAFFRTIDRNIRSYIGAIGHGTDPLRRRASGGYRIQNAWSVRLKAAGFHLNHVHQQGWLSSAFYVDIPPAIRNETRDGWLKLGEPGIATPTALDAEHSIKPEPGLLALFPSYMWHGTVPFSGARERLTIAFDVVPS